MINLFLTLSLLVQVVELPRFNTQHVHTADAISYLCNDEPKGLDFISISDQYDVIYICIKNKNWTPVPNSNDPLLMQLKRLDFFLINFNSLDLKLRYSKVKMNFN